MRRNLTRWNLLAIILIIGTWMAISVPKFPEWTGINGKTAWNLAEILIIPIALSLVAFFLNKRQKETETEIAKQQRETDRELSENRLQEGELQAYYDRMSQLLLEYNLRTSEPNAEVRSVARARTVTVLRNLDTQRKQAVFQFLFEAGLINREKIIVSLEGASIEKMNFAGMKIHNILLGRLDLSNVYFSRSVFQFCDFSRSNMSSAQFIDTACLDCIFDDANLRKALARGFHGVSSSFVGSDLSGSDFAGANLPTTKFDRAEMQGIDLRGANMFKSSLQEANLTRANLETVNLQQANLFGANIKDAVLRLVIATQADFHLASLQGANLENANLQSSILERAILQGANLTNAHLGDANLRGANLVGANLTNAILDGVQVEDIIFDETTIWPAGFRFHSKY